MARPLTINRWWQRLVLSIALVSLVYLAFGIVAHLTDPRWPPLAFGEVRTTVAILTWPGAWILAILVVVGMNPFPPGAAYLSIWGMSICAYVLLLFLGMSLGAWIRRRRSTPSRSAAELAAEQ